MSITMDEARLQEREQCEMTETEYLAEMDADDRAAAFAFSDEDWKAELDAERDALARLDYEELVQAA